MDKPNTVLFQVLYKAMKYVIDTKKEHFLRLAATVTEIM